MSNIRGSRARTRVASIVLLGLVAGLSVVMAPTAARAATTGSGYIPFPTGFVATVTQGNFGSFSHNNVWNYYAWDFAGANDSIAGEPVWSATAGTVVYARNNFQGQAGSCPFASGNFVIVDNHDGTFTQYLHMQYLSEPVRVGDAVTVGQRLGTVGNTGNTTGYHLHVQWLRQMTDSTCGIGYSTPGSFVGIGVPSTGQVLSSNNPGTSGTHHYFKVTGTGGAGLNERSGPGTSFSLIRVLAEGTTVDILCQTRSTSSVGGSFIWDKLNDAPRGWVSDYYLNTPVFNGFTPGIPRC